MAPLDTGSVTNVVRLAEPIGRGPAPLATESATLGAYLRAVREHKGLSLIQVAEATRVRRLYLEALERDDIAPLPSRPFAVGYVRAYGRALGLDGDAAVARFKAENPEATQALRAPLGVHLDANPRRRVIYAGAAVLVVAVALWNIAQHTLISNTHSDAILAPEAQSWPEAQRSGPDPMGSAPTGPVVIGAPAPPPADQTTPKPYVTPGLGVPGIDKNASADPIAVAAAATTAARPDPAPPATFTTRATVYGAPAKEGGVLVQAKSPASLVVRGPAGQIYFARELETGEAYRAPLGRGLTADVSDPDAFLLYVGGKLAGPLSDPQTPLDKAAAAAAQPQLAAR
jgi:transcriptional regulator with XRE-family HTH domain